MEAIVVSLWALRWWIIIPLVGIVGVRETGWKSGLAFPLVALLAASLIDTPLVVEICCLLFVAFGGKTNKKLTVAILVLIGIMLAAALFKSLTWSYLLFGALAIVGLYLLVKLIKWLRYKMSRRGFYHYHY